MNLGLLGAVGGLGQGIADNSKAMMDEEREKRMKELEANYRKDEATTAHERAVERDSAQRGWQSGENQLNRSHEEKKIGLTADAQIRVHDTNEDSDLERLRNRYERGEDRFGVFTRDNVTGDIDYKANESDATAPGSGNADSLLLRKIKYATDQVAALFGAVSDPATGKLNLNGANPNQLGVAWKHVEAEVRKGRPENLVVLEAYKKGVGEQINAELSKKAAQMADKEIERLTGGIINLTDGIPEGKTSEQYKAELTIKYYDELRAKRTDELGGDPAQVVPSQGLMGGGRDAGRNGNHNTNTGKDYSSMWSTSPVL